MLKIITFSTISFLILAISSTTTFSQCDSSLTIKSNDTTICQGQSVVLLGPTVSQNVCTKSQLPLNLQQGLIALYPFCGNANDESGNGNNGIVNGATLTTDRFGNANNAYSFDGINDYINRAALPDLTSLTISAWVFHTNGHNHSNILCDMNHNWGNDLYMSMSDSTIGIMANKNGALLALASGWGGTSPPPQAISNLNLENQWKHIVWVMYPTYSTVYINGVITGTFNYTGSNVGYHDVTNIGRLNDGVWDGNYFKGKIDDIYIYNRTLSASEIQQLYNTGGITSIYNWSTGATTQNITVTPLQTTTYYLTVTYGSCSIFDSVKVTVSPLPIVNLGNDTTICQGNNLLLNAGNAGAAFTWNTGATSQQLNVTISGTYWVKVTNSNGCYRIDTIVINFGANFSVNIGNDTTICQGQSVFLLGPAGTQNVCFKSQLPINLQQGLIAFYPFCGNANDESGNGNNGIVNGSTLTTDRFGNSNSAYSFDGINNYINRAPLPDMTSLTISAWVFHTNGHNHSNILCDMNHNWGNDLYMSISDSTIGIMANKNGALLALASGWGGTSPPPQAISNLNLENQWKHIVWVMYSTYSTVYINGVIAGIFNYTGSNVGYHDVTNIGRLNDGVWDGNYFKGKIDDVYIYNRTLSASEIQQLYNTGASTFLSYNWSTGDTTQNITVTPPQTTTYYLTATNGSCSNIDSVKVTVSPLPIVNLGIDTTICQGNNLLLNAGNVGATYYWSTGATVQQINVTNSGTYWVKVINNIGCFVKDTINVNFVSNLTVNLGIDTTICQGNNLLLDAGNAGGTYLWSTGSTSQQLNITNSGTYSIIVNNSNCYGFDTINISIVQNQIISLGNDTIMCPGDFIFLSPGLGFDQYLWSDGSTLNYLNVFNPGNYSVTVFYGLCSIIDSIFIDECGSEIWVPNVFTPNGDGINDFFAPIFQNIDKITLYIYNRWGNQIFEGSSKSINWDGKYKGSPCPEGIYYYLIEYEKKGKNKGMLELHGSVTLLH